MSLAATTRAYDCRPRSPAAKLILIRLADFADEYGCTELDFADLAGFAMCSEEEVGLELALLERDGFLETESNGRRAVRLAGGA